MFSRRFLLALAALCASLGSARADLINIGDNELPGQFTGTVEVTNQTFNSALIRVTLTNTSPFSNGGFLTAFAFNDPNRTSKGNIGTVTNYQQQFDPQTGQNFALLGAPTFSDSVSSAPFGLFDIGAGVGGSWHSGGSPVDGLAVGETGTFSFLVNGTSLNNLTAANLLTSMSSTGTAGFVVRFRGFADGSSDKDVAGVIVKPPVNNPVPAPPALVLAGIGFVALIGRARRKQVA
jgi:hypothetical protein